jgi:membrane-associated protein
MEEFLAALLRGLGDLADFILHIDVHLDGLVAEYGRLVYLILFGIVFWETGVVIMPFLPGDSLLFAAGAIAGREAAPISVWTLFAVIGSAAFLGDTLNYWIGRFLGPRALRGDGRFLKRKYLDMTREFYTRHGAKTIVLARFVPIVRTFAPFVAGVGAMSYRRFLFYNLTGGLAWTFLFVGAGFFFGSLPLVRRNFTLVILAIVALSVMPMVIEFIRARRRAAASPVRPLDVQGPGEGAAPAPAPLAGGVLPSRQAAEAEPSGEA